MIEVMQVLPVRILKVGDTTLKYVIIAVGMTNEPLEEITGYKPQGRKACALSHVPLDLRWAGVVQTLWGRATNYRTLLDDTDCTLMQCYAFRLG